MPSTFDWVNVIGGASYDETRATAIDSANNLFVVGGTQSNPFIVNGVSYSKPDTNATYDVFVIKYDSSGVVQWLQWMYGTDTDFSGGIGTDPSGNLYMSGSNASDTVTIGGTTYSTVGYGRCFFVKLDGVTGSVEWVQFLAGTNAAVTFGPIQYNNGYMYIPQHLNAGFGGGDYTIGGTTYSLGQYEQTDILLKYDFSGVVQAIVPLATITTQFEGGLGQICFDPSGNIYTNMLVGEPSFTFNGTEYCKPSNGYDKGCFIVKYNSSGVVQWMSQFIDSSSDEDYVPSIAYINNRLYTAVYTTNPDILIGTTTYSNTSTVDSFLVTIDANSGNFLDVDVFYSGGDYLTLPAMRSVGAYLYICGRKSGTSDVSIYGTTYSSNTTATFIARIDPATKTLADIDFINGNGSSQRELFMVSADGTVAYATVLDYSSASGITVNGGTGYSKYATTPLEAFVARYSYSAPPAPPEPPAPTIPPNGQLTNGVMLENSLQKFPVPMRRGGFFKVRTAPP
jgi:hypothetical protein